MVTSLDNQWCRATRWIQSLIFSCYPFSFSMLWKQECIPNISFAIVIYWFWSVQLENRVKPRLGLLRQKIYDKLKGREKIMESVELKVVVVFSPLKVSRDISDAALLSAICYPAMVAASNQEQIFTPHTHTHTRTHTSQITGVWTHGKQNLPQSLHLGVENVPGRDNKWHLADCWKAPPPSAWLSIAKLENDFRKRRPGPGLNILINVINPGGVEATCWWLFCF